MAKKLSKKAVRAIAVNYLYQMHSLDDAIDSEGLLTTEQEQQVTEEIRRLVARLVGMKNKITNLEEPTTRGIIETVLNIENGKEGRTKDG